MVEIDLIIDGAKAEQLHLSPTDEFATEIGNRKVVLEVNGTNAEISRALTEIRDYKQELVSKRDDAEKGELADGKEFDMVDLAHLSGKISGLDAGIAAIKEALEC